jgi:hypothetical protein
VPPSPERRSQKHPLLGSLKYRLATMSGPTK